MWECPLSIYGHPLSFYTSKPSFSFLFREKRNRSLKSWPMSTDLLKFPTNNTSDAERESNKRCWMAVWLADMWNSRATEKSGAMKLQPENIKVFYFASDCVEPYVEVRLLGGAVRYCGVWIFSLSWAIHLCFLALPPSSSSVTVLYVYNVQIYVCLLTLKPSCFFLASCRSSQWRSQNAAGVCAAQRTLRQKSPGTTMFSLCSVTTVIC